MIVCAADTKEPPRLLNYLTAPNCIIWSAVACSSAFPGLFKPQDLLARDRCGGYCRCVPPLSFPELPVIDLTFWYLNACAWALVHVRISPEHA